MQNKEIVDLRRKLIFRWVVLDNRALPLKDVTKFLRECAGKYDRDYDKESAQRDIDAFRDVGCELDLKPCQTDPQDHEIRFLEGPHLDNDVTREHIHETEKNLVAAMAASLVFGIPRQKESVPRWLDTHVAEAINSLRGSAIDEKRVVALIRGSLKSILEKHNVNKASQDVLGLLKRGATLLTGRQDRLRKELISFWAETNRLVAIDSGTTNICLARYLKEQLIPVPGSQLCSLTVCTNSRRIFEVLGPSDVWVKTIIVGGQQMFRSPTIAGPMAEQFLRSASILQFGMCILGSTRIDMDKFAICSDSQEESSIKNLLMERSSLRIICVDNHKLQSGPGRAGYRFASITPEHVDLLITNGPLKQGRTKEEYENFLYHIQLIEARGVPVLVATSSKTYPYPPGDQTS
jgi:DeoR/GlpR family transcriptional regulator of sugar metabolism